MHVTSDLGHAARVTLLLGILFSGCVDPSMLKKKEQAETAPAPAPAAAPAPQPQVEAAPAAPTFPQDSLKLVDKKKALAENPALVETENRVNTMDPLLAVSQSMFAIGSKAEVLALQHNIDIHKAQYDKPPTFQEFEEMIRSARVQFKGLYRWQVYAYDDSTGEICILEDKAMKKKLYEEQGLKAE